MTPRSPAEVILARVDAFQEADFGFIFDTYHSQSAFRQQFTERDDYIRFGWASLGKDFRILKCRIVAEDDGPREARVIYFMELDVNGEFKSYAELTWLWWEENAWRCHRSQKIETDDLPCPPDQLDFQTFENFEPKVIF
ncbi:MAG TPA: hypothetical protein VJ910_01655 [Desulfuromonadales bacterium]|nr:hypothetical protein [Desulfuromonadales bacterium]